MRGGWAGVKVRNYVTALLVCYFAVICLFIDGELSAAIPCQHASFDSVQNYFSLPKLMTRS